MYFNLKIILVIVYKLLFKFMVIYFSLCWEIYVEWVDLGSSENLEDLEGI